MRRITCVLVGGVPLLTSANITDPQANRSRAEPLLPFLWQVVQGKFVVRVRHVRRPAQPLEFLASTYHLLSLPRSVESTLSSSLSDDCFWVLTKSPRWIVQRPYDNRSALQIATCLLRQGRMRSTLAAKLPIPQPPGRKPYSIARWRAASLVGLVTHAKSGGEGRSAVRFGLGLIANPGFRHLQPFRDHISCPFFLYHLLCTRPPCCFRKATG